MRLTSLLLIGVIAAASAALFQHFRSTAPNVAVVLASAGFHAILFILTPIEASTAKGAFSRAYLKSTIVSTVHSLVVIIYVAVWLTRYTMEVSNLDRTIGGGVDGTGDEHQSAVMAYSIGYFVYDFVVIHVYREVWSMGTFMHHILILLSFGMGLFGGIARPLHFFYLLEELSTPFLNLKTLYRHNERLHTLWSLLFAVSFIGCRMVYGMWIYVNIVMMLTRFPDSKYYTDPFKRFQFYFQIITCTGTRILNFYWTFLILGKVFGSGKSHKKKKILNIN